MIDPGPPPMVPANIEAELCALGSMLLDNAAIDDLAGAIRPDDFFRDSHRLLCRRIFDLHGSGGPVDAVTLVEDLERRGEFREVGGDEAIRAVLEAPPHAANAAYYAAIVHQKAVARRLIEQANATARECYSNTFAADELLARAEARLYAIGDLRAAGETVDSPLALDEADALLGRRSAGEITGVPSGLAEVDDLTGGFQPGSLTIVGARPSMGKAQPLDAKVLTPGGFVRMGDLMVGDHVTGSDGRPCRVVGVYPQGELPVFRVTTTDGGSTECCEEHLWFTQTRNERRKGVVGSVKSLRQIARTLSRDLTSPNHAIPVGGMVEFDFRPWPDFEPYALGLLLGDGSFRGSCVRFTNPEPDLFRALRELLPIGDELVHAGGIEYRIKRLRRANGVSFTREFLIRYGLDGLGTKGKFIPPEYLMGSIDCRLALLRGLMDSDGFVTSGGQSVEFCTSSSRLASDVATLARSLSGIVSTRVHATSYSYRDEMRAGAESSRMVLRFPNGLVPVSSEKHRAKWKGDRHRYHRSIASIEPSGFKQCRCIAVDAPDRLYVTDDFIITHNTAFGLNVADFAATRAGVVPLVVSLEMGRAELATRLLAARAGVDGYRLRNAWLLTDAEWARLREAGAVLRAHSFPIDESSSRTAAQIASNARRLRSRRGVGLVIVDYLQLVDGDGQNRQEQVASISRRLKSLAKELDVPVIALSQINRAVEAREDHRPRMADLRESGAIEQDADVVILLHRPDYYDPEDQPGIAEAIVAKNRNGATGTVRLCFRREVARFFSLFPEGA